MIVVAVIGATDDRHHQVTVFPDLRVSHRRFEFVAIRVDPCLEIKSFQRLDRWHYFLLSSPACDKGLYAIAFISISRYACGKWRTATVVRAGPCSSKNWAYTSL